MALEIESKNTSHFADLPNDTHPVIEEMQFAYLRRLGRSERFERGLRRSEEALQLMRRSFRQSHPEWSEEQLQVEWVRAQHGEELAARVEKWLQNRMSR